MSPFPTVWGTIPILMINEPDGMVVICARNPKGAIVARKNSVNIYASFNFLFISDIGILKLFRRCTEKLYFMCFALFVNIFYDINDDFWCIKSGNCKMFLYAIGYQTNLLRFSLGCIILFCFAFAAGPALYMNLDSVSTWNIRFFLEFRGFASCKKEINSKVSKYYSDYQHFITD